jgi:hypothetical protein
MLTQYFHMSLKSQPAISCVLFALVGAPYKGPMCFHTAPLITFGGATQQKALLRFADIYTSAQCTLLWTILQLNPIYLGSIEPWAPACTYTTESLCFVDQMMCLISLTDI